MAAALRKLPFRRRNQRSLPKINVGYIRLIDALRQWFVTRVLSPWSISSRLLVAFASVAVLAAAANFIVERSVSIVTGSSTVVAPLAPVVEEAVEPAAPAVEVPAPLKSLSGAELIRALGRFDESVYLTVQSDAVERQARYRQSGKELDRATESFMAQAKAADERSYKSIPGSVHRHKRDAAKWIELSQRRRELLGDYSETLERMNGRVNASLDGAFKIFGRVVARQSLVRLNTSLSELRDSFAGVVRTWSTTPEIFDPLTRTEAAFAKSLQDNAKSLRSAESDEWFSAMEKDFATLTELRATLVHTHNDLVATGTGFLAQSTQLLARMPKDEIATVVKVPAQAAPALKTQSPTAEPADVQAAPVRASPQTNVRTETTQIEPTESNRALVAWISAAVLALLLWISVATVRSVVLPVRRLIAASDKIASGQPDARVVRGGIKELDSLAIAFNNMAERLASAQALAHDTHRQLEEKVAERTRELQELAEIDPLTGLPNRRHLFSLLNSSIERAARSRRRVGVLFLDVDNFKNINDSIGHSFGDRVLRGIAQRLQIATQPRGLAARLGGDEFTVICENVSSLEEIRDAGEQIIRAFQTPIDVDGRDVIIGVSVGVSIYPDHELDAENLLIAADTALFHTKALGRGRVSVFTPALLEGASNKFRIEQDLRHAIERNEFELFFQPEVGIEDLQTQLVEALIRWHTPDGRYIPPVEFLSVAEESGLIIEISDWVLRTSIRAASQWHHGSWPQARVAINVSPRQLLDYRFVDRVRELLAEHNLPPRCIEIELTESVLQTGPATIEQLHRLRALGVAIALDDFGTGYSSLSSLERLPLTRVKLDRSLIESIDSNTRSRSIVRAIIDMCNGLGLQVTAEGLERAEQFERFLGCKNLSLQGYLLSRPVAMEQIFSAMTNAAQRAQELVLLSKPNAVASVIKQLPMAPSRSAGGHT